MSIYDVVGPAVPWTDTRGRPPFISLSSFLSQFSDTCTFVATMTAIIGKAGKKLFARHLEQYAPADPLYETYTNEKGKTKRRPVSLFSPTENVIILRDSFNKRPLPPGLSKRDARILKSVQKRAYHLDKGFHVCGFRFGWTFFIGIIPVVGDVTNLTLNQYLVVRKAKQADIPPWLVRRMQINNVVSTGIGFVPFVGDVIVAVYKANSRNAALLEEFLRIRGEEFLKLHPEVATGNGRNDRSGWSWLTRNRMSPKDAEQVKPGAGMTPDETVPAAGNLYMSSADENGSLPSSSGPTVDPALTNGTSTSVRNGRKGFSILGRSKKPASPSRPSSTQGRFVNEGKSQ
jgi:hypothetical protein